MSTSSLSNGRRSAAVAGAIGLVASLAVSVAGTARAAVPDKWGFAFVSAPAVPSVPADQAGSWPAPLKVHVTHNAAKQVFVWFPRLASKDGVVHVTAVNQGPVWCDAQKWVSSGLSEVVVVRCYKAPGGTPVFSPFTVLYTTSSKAPFPGGRAYGYIRYQPGSGVIARFNSAGAVNTVTPGPVGVWLVRMPGLGSTTLAGGVQVTAVDPAGPAKCEIAGWAAALSGQRFLVRCFNGGTTPLKVGWTLSYQRARAITGRQPKYFAYTFDNLPLATGPYAPAPPRVNFNSMLGINTVSSAGAGLRLVHFPRVGQRPDAVFVSGFKTGPGFCNLLTAWATFPAVRNVIVRDVACYTTAGKHKSQPSLITYTSAH
ncbi:MAG TPA: hypothetical protein VNF47_24160 [Streptosporangiaceae bacterium]|nr:hypothetical protein [Streptosporangiaceae bacterium]